jgi:hypothetical protein
LEKVLSEHFFYASLLVERFCLHCPVRRNDMTRPFSVAIACMYRIVTTSFGVASLKTNILEPYSATAAARKNQNN